VRVHRIALGLLLAPIVIGRAQGAPALCRDSVETRAIACSAGAARRVGPTLHLRLRGGRELTFADDTAGEAPGGFYYTGRLGRTPFQLVESYGHETYPSWIVVNDSTGQRVENVYQPVLSPDSRRFAGTAEGWDNCSEGDGPALEIWRVTDSVPVREFRWRPGDCRHFVGWGPTDARWRGTDTLVYTRRQIQSRETTTGLIVRRGGRWEIVAPVTRRRRGGSF
jgi:hypothetical protein